MLTFSSFRSSLLLLALTTSAAFAATTVFAPFEQWRAAVNSGDLGALTNSYSAAPPAVTLLERTRVEDPGEEPQFWAALRSSGLADFNPKVLELEQSGKVMKILLRLEAVKTDGGGRQMVATMVQIWQQQPGGWRIVATQRTPFVPGVNRTLPQPSKPNPALYPDTGEAQAELKNAYTLAAKEHKRILVVFGANWCYDCHVLDATFRSKSFAPLVNANYIVVHINIGDEGKDNNDLAQRLGVGLDRGIPSLAVLDSSGKVLVAQNNGEFESTVKIGPQDVRSFLEKWKPAASR